MQLDLDQPISQRQFAILLNTSREAINEAFRAGILVEGASALEWLRAMHKARTESAAGRTGNGPLDLVQERARLAALQSEKLQIELDELRGKLWPVGPIAETLGWHIANLKTKMLSLPHRFKSIAPSTAPRDINALDDLIREALTDFAQLRLPSRFVQMTQRYFEERHSNAKRTALSLIEGEDQPNRRPGKRSSKKVARNRTRGPAQSTRDVASHHERLRTSEEAETADG